MRYLVYRRFRPIGTVDVHHHLAAEQLAGVLYDGRVCVWNAESDPLSRAIADDIERRADQAEAECTGVVR